MQTIKEHTIQKETKVQLGTPNKPLNNSITDKLIKQFEKNSNILEVYQYGLTKNGEFSIVIAFKLSNSSEDAKKAIINAAQDILEKETINQLLDLFFIEDIEWYEKIINVESSLLYKR